MNFGAMWQSITGFFDDISSGWSTGDFFEDNPELRGFVTGPTIDSIGYKIGDYAEDAWDWATGFAKKTTADYITRELTGSGSRLPQRQVASVRSGAGSGYQTTGKYRASRVNYNEVGYKDSRVQQAGRQLARSMNPHFQAAFNPINPNLRQNTRNLTIDPNPGINIRTQTKAVEIS